MNKVDDVISKYLEATGLWCEAPVLTPDEQKAVTNVQQQGVKTKGGEKLAKVIQNKTKKQDQNAATAAGKIEKS